MSQDYTLPVETDWTVDDLAILPDECRYELIEGRLDLQGRESLARLAGLALIAELRAACPPGFEVAARTVLAGVSAEFPVPDIAVLDPEGSAVLVADLPHSGRHLAEMVTRVNLYSKRGIAHCWVFEAVDDVGAVLTTCRISEGGGFVVESSTSEVFVTDLPFPMSIDLPLISNWWPETFEYIGERRADIISW